ncbi:MAG: hypothetical protein JO297_15730 [Nitrososphaeraceae archaeon]|nr:hypothetical protein [Nitrososphaeraceae archaeon]
MVEECLSSMRNNEEEVQADNQKQKEEEEYSLSPILSTRYAYKAAKMVSLIGKNFLIIIGIVAAVLFFTAIDLLQETGHITSWPNNDITDNIIVGLVAASLAALLSAFWMLLRSRNLLNNWANVFEQNSIRTGMSIIMADKTREEAVLAVAEVIEEISVPMRKYIATKEKLEEFFDVTTMDSRSRKRRGKQLEQEQGRSISFDVLIDADHILRTTNDAISDDLKEILRKYGAIIIKIVDGIIDKKSVQSFSNSLADYISLSKKNKVGLALIIGDDFTHDANNIARHYRNKRIDDLIIIEKPSSNKLSKSDALDITNQLKHAEVGAHYIVIYPDLMALREIYSHYIKTAIEENNEVVVMISHYESADNIKRILSSTNSNNSTTGVNPDKYEKDGSLVILDSKSFFDLDYNSFIKNLLNRAKSMNRNDVCILADNRLLFDLHRIEEFIQNETSMPVKFDINLKRICMVLRQDFDTLTEEQKRKLLTHHGKHLQIRC